MAHVYEVLEVHTDWSKSLPPTFTVKATGTTRSGGYTAPRLEKRIYVTPPADGIQDYDFVATPPDGASTSAITPIEAEDAWHDPPQWLKGARVHSETNQMESK